MYVTAKQLADGSGNLRELAELYTVDEALLGVVIAQGSTDAWEPSQVSEAAEAVASIERFAVQATAEVDARLVQRGYTVPMDPTQFGILTVWARAIARYHLHPQRDNTTQESGRIERDYRSALNALELVATGKLTLGANDPLAPAPVTDEDGGPTRVSSRRRMFDRRTLRGL